MMNLCAVPKCPVPFNPLDGDRWMHIHNRFLSETKEKEPDVLFLGDSVTSQLEQRCVWTNVFMPMHALNFSIIGDGTQNILWRVQNGELENMKPKVIVVYAGGMNIPSSPPANIVEGVLEIVKTIHSKQLEATVFVQQLPQRGQFPNPLREKIDCFNKLLIDELQDLPRCKVVPVGDKLVKSDGTISYKDLYDGFYPTNDGYLKIFGPLIQDLKNILNEGES